ncbi:hypothetical protein AB5J55_18445 [Streptomyces sp. R11]|uniref:MHYT domain-containing protein n=1 Tax=Streptomyces sp. R11 TaxID=3238625 RepID=A0AB39N171_9ACTN
MTYRDVASKQVLIWACTAVASRMPVALAAGYSVMYAAAGAGYAATGSLAGGLLQVVTPSTAIVAGVALTLLLTALGWWGEARRDGSSAAGDLDVGLASGAEGAAIVGGRDAERRL